MAQKYSDIRNSDLVPQVLVFGAAKCATSWMSACLTEHPEIAVMPQSIGGAYTLDTRGDIDKQDAWYASLKKGKVSAEISPWYFITRGVPERIKELAPDTRLILMLRHPVERAASAIRHVLGKHPEYKGTSVVELIKKYPNIVDVGHYERHLGRYLKTFDRSQILIILTDDVQSHPHDVVKEVYRFIGVSDDFLPKMVTSKTNTGAARASWLYPKYLHFLKWARQIPGAQVLKGALAKVGITPFTLERKIEALGKTSQYRLSQKDTEWLQTEYQDTITWLDEILDRDLTAWRRSRQHPS